jgi:hypothetical protein
MRSYRTVTVDTLQDDYLDGISSVWKLVSEMEQCLDDSITLSHVKDYCLRISMEIEKIEALQRQLKEQTKTPPWWPD